MKKIGLVGGTGPESTVMYYKELNSRTYELTGGKMMPDILIDSVDFCKAWDYVSNGRNDLLADYLEEKIRSLIAGGAEVVSLTAGTMHIVYDELVKRTGADLISIPQAVAEFAREQGYKKIGLLGTIFTMENDFMKTAFIDSGIEVYVPQKSERELIAKRIFEELEQGIVKEETLKEFVAIIERMKKDDGIEAVVLGCTELPLILNKDNCPLPCLDSVDIHIQKLIKIAMSN